MLTISCEKGIITVCTMCGGEIDYIVSGSLMTEACKECTYAYSYTINLPEEAGISEDLPF